MRYLLVIFFSFFTFQSNIYSHYNWLDVSCFFPKQGDTISYFIKSGHQFPKSSFQINKSLIKGPFLYTLSTNNKIIGFEKNNSLTSPGHLRFEPSSNYLTGKIKLKEEKAFFIAYSLKKKHMKYPVHQAKVIFLNNYKQILIPPYLIGSGLEISPTIDFSKEITNEIPFQVYFNGIVVPATITVIPENSKPYYIGSTKNKPAIIILKNCPYLLYTTYNGRTCSLVFKGPKSKSKT